MEARHDEQAEKMDEIKARGKPDPLLMDKQREQHSNNKKKTSVRSRGNGGKRRGDLRRGEPCVMRDELSPCREARKNLPAVLTCQCRLS